MLSLAQDLKQYDHEHSSRSNKWPHGLGIPLIFYGILSFFLGKWILGASLFIGGWLLVFASHRIEGNELAFYAGTVYLLMSNLGSKRSMSVPSWNRSFQGSFLACGA